MLSKQKRNDIIRIIKYLPKNWIIEERMEIRIRQNKIIGIWNNWKLHV